MGELVRQREGERERRVGGREGGRYVRVMESECNKGVGCILVGC